MKRYIFYLSLLWVLGSCVSFKEVNTFATRSEESINSYKNIDYTFSGNCYYKCAQRALESAFFQTTEKNCSCKDAVIADSNVNLLLNTLKNYFKAMSKLSDSKLTDYSFDVIEKPLVEGKYIKKADMKSYTRIVGLITQMITDQYRVKKLKKIINTGNADIILLLGKTVEIFEDNLLPTLSSRQENIQQIYHDLYNAPGTSAFEKFNIQKMYFAELTLIAAKKSALKKFSTAMEKISKGHQSLYDNKDKLKEKDVKKIMNMYVYDLNAITEQIKK